MKTTRRRIATPLARRIARDRGLDISSLTGSGPKGRIVAGDVEAALGKPTAAAVRTSEPAHMVAPTNVERVMAETVSSSKRDIPHFYLSTDIEVTALMQARGEAKQSRQSPQDHPYPSSRRRHRTRPA